MPWSRVEAEIIIRGLAKANPIEDGMNNGEPDECIFCHAISGFGGLRHNSDCVWVAANRLVDELGPVPKVGELFPLGELGKKRKK